MNTHCLHSGCLSNYYLKIAFRLSELFGEQGDQFLVRLAIDRRRVHLDLVNVPFPAHDLAF